MQTTNFFPSIKATPGDGDVIGKVFLIENTSGTTITVPQVTLFALGSLVANDENCVAFQLTVVTRDGPSVADPGAVATMTTKTADEGGTGDWSPPALTCFDFLTEPFTLEHN